MIYKGELKGNFVTLRSVMPKDAEFILKLRQREDISKFLHKVDNSIDKQVEWIKTHQAMDGDYYFLIWDKNYNKRIGTISLYNKEEMHCEIGRAASIGTVVENIDAIIVTYDFAFKELKYDYLIGTISPENSQVKELDKKFGFKFNDEVLNIDGMQLQSGKILKEDYYKKRPEIVRLLERAKKILS